MATTIHALIDRAQLREGETLAVLGAAGGTGVAAIEDRQGPGRKGDRLRLDTGETGLRPAMRRRRDHRLHARKNLRDRLKELTGGAGIDVLYDPVGGDLAELPCGPWAGAGAIW